MSAWYSHAVDLRPDLARLEMRVQLGVVLLEDVVLDALQLVSDDVRVRRVVGPREGTRRQDVVVLPCNTSCIIARGTHEIKGLDRISVKCAADE